MAVLALVIVVDQVTKWWAWRHLPGTIINYGGNKFVGAKVGDWYADPVTGALLDFVDVGLLILAASVLLCRPRRPVILVSAALVIGGWSSNLLDRLGLHYWSAPGSVRGAVDFIELGSRLGIANIADFCIAGGTLLFLLAVSHPALRAAKNPADGASIAPATRSQPRIGMRVTALVGATALAFVVWIGAANHSGLTVPLAAVSAPAHLRTFTDVAT
jgi:lipoprotein signal peptidase